MHAHQKVHVAHCLSIPPTPPHHNLVSWHGAQTKESSSIRPQVEYPGFCSKCIQMLSQDIKEQHAIAVQNVAECGGANC